MYKAVTTVLSILAISSLLPVQASSAATVFALESEVWARQGDEISRLSRGSDIKAGDRVVTGDSGRVELRIGEYVSVRLNTTSEVLFNGSAGTEGSGWPDITLQSGKSCIRIQRLPDGDRQFEVALGDTMSIILQREGFICLLHQDGLSSVHLREGSIQVSHSVDSNIIVLSEPGSEFQVEFGESYSVLLPEFGEIYHIASEGFPLAIAESEAAGESNGDANVSSQVEPEAATEVSTEIVPEVSSSDESPQPVSSYDATSKYIYTVYLFSTRSRDVADEVNQRFQRAGYPSQIFTGESDGNTRYRVVVTGFSSREAAGEFADSMIGKLGIEDTWIGRNQRE